MFDKIPLNFPMMKNPFNWAILTLMVVIGGLAIHLLFPTDAGSVPANTKDA